MGGRCYMLYYNSVYTVEITLASDFRKEKIWSVVLLFWEIWTNRKYLLQKQEESISCKKTDWKTNLLTKCIWSKSSPSVKTRITPSVTTTIRKATRQTTPSNSTRRLGTKEEKFKLFQFPFVEKAHFISQISYPIETAQKLFCIKMLCMDLSVVW